jgi:hypothetical protein
MSRQLEHLLLAKFNFGNGHFILRDVSDTIGNLSLNEGECV